jgi:hypothetical protein
MFNLIVGIMNKRMTQRIFTVLSVAILFISGLMAQTHNGTAPEGAAASYVSGATQTSTYITEGKTVPVYALPDAYFHPSYNVGTSNYTLTDGFTWAWSEATTTLTFSQNNAQDNYVRVTAPAGSAAGSPYTVNVVETPPAAWGACTDAGTNLTVNVVPIPAVAFVAPLVASYDVCATNIASLPAQINATISGGWQNYWLAWTLQVKTLTATGTDLAFYQTDKSTTMGAGGLAVNNTTATPDKTATAAGNYNIMTVANFNIIGTNTTVFTYTLTSINDRASRFGDFIGLNGNSAVASNFQYYPAGAFNTITITVHPTPTTGPIFHITNTWAN